MPAITADTLTLPRLSVPADAAWREPYRVVTAQKFLHHALRLRAIIKQPDHSFRHL